MIAICITLFGLVIGAMATSSGGKGLEVVEGFNIDIKYNSETTKVDFTFIIPNGTWMGIVLGSNLMMDSDII
jgi:hypothetical protein